MRHRLWHHPALSSLLLLLTWLCMPAMADEDSAALETAFELFQSKSFDHKAEGIELIARSGHERSKTILEALLKSRLFIKRDDKQIVIGEKLGKQYRINSALAAENLGTIKKRKLKKVGINNNLRRQIRTALATIDLSHPDPSVRLEAAQSMTGKTDQASLDLFRTILKLEQDSKVREALLNALAIAQLDAPDPQERLKAIDQVAGNLDPAIRAKLAHLEQDKNYPEVAQAAKRALDSIEFKLQIFSVLETLFFGVSLGSVLVLAAIGLAITFGVMGVINMAHGELIMLGAYTTYLIQQLLPDYTGVSLLISIPAAFVVSGLVGILIERTVIRFLYGRPLETLLATFGISLILQQLVRTLISPQNVPVSNPEWMSGALEINSVLALTYNRLYIILFCLLVFIALFLILKRTSLGLQVRAVSQNRDMARAMGVRSARVDALTFGLGSGIAGVAGVALSQLTNVGPNLGQSYIIDSFMVVVFGGVGNLWGTLVGGLSLGVANKILEPWSGAVLAKILVLVFIILFIQKRPRGLFPQKGRAAGD
ncbi:MAG: urea ABC transporter permease subunit UrtB [Gammaproteobacteria bacterium]|nr:urea ABC transporter permease subunit UrtB [Gammaproteobacteria bacterium]